jgi:hypothetical protein
MTLLRFLFTFLIAFIVLFLIAYLAIPFLVDQNEPEFGRIGQGMLILYISALFSFIAALAVSLWTVIRRFAHKRKSISIKS